MNGEVTRAESNSLDLQRDGVRYAYFKRAGQSWQEYHDEQIAIMGVLGDWLHDEAVAAHRAESALGPRRPGDDT